MRLPARRRGSGTKCQRLSRDSEGTATPRAMRSPLCSHTACSGRCTPSKMAPSSPGPSSTDSGQPSPSATSPGRRPAVSSYSCASAVSPSRPITSPTSPMRADPNLLAEHRFRQLQLDQGAVDFENFAHLFSRCFDSAACQGFRCAGGTGVPSPRGPVHRPACDWRRLEGLVDLRPVVRQAHAHAAFADLAMRLQRDDRRPGAARATMFAHIGARRFSSAGRTSATRSPDGRPGRQSASQASSTAG